MIDKKFTEQISDLLRSKKIKFTLKDETSDIDFIVFYVGNCEGNIQIEYSDNIEFPDTCFQLFSQMDNHGCSLYHDYFSTEKIEEFDGNLEELIEALKNQNRILNKIETRIDQIKELAEELNTDLETFITINYEF